MMPVELCLGLLVKRCRCIDLHIVRNRHAARQLNKNRPVSIGKHFLNFLSLRLVAIGHDFHGAESGVASFQPWFYFGQRRDAALFVDIFGCVFKVAWSDETDSEMRSG